MTTAVALHGLQNAVENWSRVTFLPSCSWCFSLTSEFTMNELLVRTILLSSSFDTELNYWLLENTKYQAIRLSTEEMCETQIPVTPGSLCIILGRTKSSNNNDKRSTVYSRS